MWGEKKHEGIVGRKRHVSKARFAIYTMYANGLNSD